MAQFPLEGLTDYRPTYRAQIVQALAEYRRDWQMATGSTSLVDAQASVGLVLADIADRLEFNSQERHAVLGGRLINQIDCAMEERVRLRLPS